MPFELTKLLDIKNFNANSKPFITKIKAYLDDYKNKVIASPTADLKHHIPQAELMQLRNEYLHYNAVEGGKAGLINGPEPERKRFIVPA